MEKLGKTKKYDVTVRHHMGGPKNSFGEEIRGMTATFTKTFFTVDKKRAVEKMEAVCKEQNLSVIKIYPPIERT